MALGVVLSNELVEDIRRAIETYAVASEGDSNDEEHDAASVLQDLLGEVLSLGRTVRIADDIPLERVVAWRISFTWDDIQRMVEDRGFKPVPVEDMDEFMKRVQKAMDNSTAGVSIDDAMAGVFETLPYADDAEPDGEPIEEQCPDCGVPVSAGEAYAPYCSQEHRPTYS